MGNKTPNTLLSGFNATKTFSKVKRLFGLFTVCLKMQQESLKSKIFTLGGLQLCFSCSFRFILRFKSPQAYCHHKVRNQNQLWALKNIFPMIGAKFWTQWMW